MPIYLPVFIYNILHTIFSISSYVNDLKTDIIILVNCLVFIFVFKEEVYFVLQFLNNNKLFVVSIYTFSRKNKLKIFNFSPDIFLSHRARSVLERFKNNWHANGFKPTSDKSLILSMWTPRDCHRYFRFIRSNNYRFILFLKSLC